MEISQNDSDFVAKMLANVYRKDAIYMSGITDLDVGQASATGWFDGQIDLGVDLGYGPKAHRPNDFYTRVSLKYVTAEQLLRCTNQLGFALIGLLVRKRKRPYRDVGLRRFLDSLMAFVITEYRASHHHMVPRGRPFSISGRITKLRVSKAGICIAKMEFSGAVEGQVSFGWKVADKK